MKTVLPGQQPLHEPQLIGKTSRLADYLKTLSPEELSKVMCISPGLAARTHQQLAEWSTTPFMQSVALDSFIGDIYSGLQVQAWSKADRDYADAALLILSGLYGIIRPYDGVMPYRLEMGYRLPDPGFSDLYTFWGADIASCLPPEGLIINLAAVEYAKTITPYVDQGRIIAPKFLTRDPISKEPAFVVVHAKIARGAFARWLVQERIEDAGMLPQFNSIGYRFSDTLSTTKEPVFICDSFGGKGLSVRLSSESTQ